MTAPTRSAPIGGAEAKRPAPPEPFKSIGDLARKLVEGATKKEVSDEHRHADPRGNRRGDALY